MQRSLRLQQLEHGLLPEEQGPLSSKAPLHPEASLQGCCSCLNKWGGLIGEQPRGGETAAALAAGTAAPATAAAAAAAVNGAAGFGSSPHGAFKPAATPAAATAAAAAAGEPSTSTTDCCGLDSRRLGVEGAKKFLDISLTPLEMWQARQVLNQRESRPLRLTRLEMVEAYAKCMPAAAQQHARTSNAL